MVPAINCEFLNEWNPKYDSVESDQEEYEEILAAVGLELASYGTLAKETFLKIIDWKAARVKGKLSTEYDEYAAAIKKTYKVSEVRSRVNVLINLDGIGVPVASTILHFMFPNEVPINDYRTVEILHAAGLIRQLSRDQKRFAPFTSAILEIRSQCPQFTIRQIDRALFAYHKLKFEPEKTGRPPGRKVGSRR